MEPNSIFVVLSLAGLSGLVAYGVLWLIGRSLLPSTNAAPDIESRDAVFLFQDELLIDYDAASFPDIFDEHVDWGTVRKWLLNRFADLPDRLTELDDGFVSKHPSIRGDKCAGLTITCTANTSRVVLSDPSHPYPFERHALLVSQKELNDAKKAFQTAPNPIWTTSHSGNLIWNNDAYLDQPGLASGMAMINKLDMGTTETNRLSVEQEDGTGPVWYEVRSTADDDGISHHASDITKIVRAETTQREFVQTLTKTFAYLTIGLAVFDRKRQLALFNPALVDLTALSAEFLSGRPDMMSFFDNLRDKQVMPEPRSYPTWRAHINAAVQSANDGLYQETWSLPNDVTYRVTGRPHPDGAVAFLFEDISAEIMLERRYRSQLDLRQSALDRLPQAVMIFGSNNVLSFCNRTCVNFLGVDPDTSFADMSVSDLVGICHTVLPQRRLWKQIEAGVLQHQLDTPVQAQGTTDNGVSLSYCIEPMTGGFKMLVLDIEGAEISDLAVTEGL